MLRLRSMNSGLVCTLLVSLGASFASRAQTLEGSLAAELNIGADGITAQAAFSGSAGVGIPLPGIALGIAPGEPVLIVNTDLNVVAIAGGVIESATGGVIPGGAAQNVIRAGLSGGDAAQVISTQAANIVARAVEQQSGGFVPASATRTVLTTAINGGDVGDAIEGVVFDLVVREATRLIAGEFGRAVQNATVSIVDADTVEDLFNRAVRGQDLGPLFRGALRQRIREL